MTNIIETLSGYRDVQRNEEIFVAYATHSIEGERRSTGPAFVSAGGPEARQMVVDWILEDSKVVDYLVKPVSNKEYFKIRRDKIFENLARTAFSSAYQYSEEDYSGIYYE